MYISEEQRKFLVIVGGSILILILDIFFIIKPLIGNMSNLQSQTGKLQASIGGLDQQISKLDSMNKKLEILKSDYALYGKKFPRDEEVPSLVQTISEVAVASKVAISALKITEASGEKEAPPSEILREVPIEINVKGGYHQLGSFINKLEALDKFLKIKNIEITYEGATPRKHNLRLLILTYTLTKA